MFVFRLIPPLNQLDLLRNLKNKSGLSFRSVKFAYNHYRSINSSSSDEKIMAFDLFYRKDVQPEPSPRSESYPLSVHSEPLELLILSLVSLKHLFLGPAYTTSFCCVRSRSLCFGLQLQASEPA